MSESSVTISLQAVVETHGYVDPDNGSWLTLAEQIARSPSRYRAGEIRAVMQNLIVLARRGLPASRTP